MMPNAGCWKLRLAVLAIATSWLTSCATAGFETGDVAACPPVVQYSRAEQAHAAKEVAALPKSMAIVGWLTDYAVLRDQVLACSID